MRQNVTNVLVVVSRWYGGVLLGIVLYYLIPSKLTFLLAGPDRFKHVSATVRFSRLTWQINSAAREAILRIPQQDTEVTQTKKSKDRRRK